MMAIFFLYKKTTSFTCGEQKSESVNCVKKGPPLYNESYDTNKIKTKEVRIMDESSLSHTRWKCQYHIVIVPKYRRKVVYGKIRKDIGEIIRKLCDYKHVEIIEAHAMPDHIHMLLSIPPSLCVSEFMGYLKGKSTLMIFERHANLKYKYGQRSFWCRGYFVDTVGKNETAIKNYIRKQLEEDYAKDQKTFKE